MVVTNTPCPPPNMQDSKHYVHTITESYRPIPNESSVALASIATIEVDALGVNVTPTNAAVRALINIWKQDKGRKYSIV